MTAESSKQALPGTTSESPGLAANRKGLEMTVDWSHDDAVLDDAGALVNV